MCAKSRPHASPGLVYFVRAVACRCVTPRLVSLVRAMAFRGAGVATIFVKKNTCVTLYMYDFGNPVQCCVLLRPTLTGDA